MAMWLRACPRCRGDVSLTDENELECLQCGWSGVTRQAADVPIVRKREGLHLGPRARKSGKIVAA